jgi:hypothetical protein
MNPSSVLQELAAAQTRLLVTGQEAQLLASEDALGPVQR